MPEDQNIEWKVTWRDEYLKWICGFANAQGGRIYIGLNDDGEVVGLTDYRQLIEDIPNKSVAALGILPEVNLLSQDDKYYVEINVAPSYVPLNYRGEYHYRCGSTKQVLKGTALNDFLMRKTGIRWDAAPVPQVSLRHLDGVSFEIFKREAKRSGRLNEEDLKAEPNELLERLHLSENGCLLRAAALLFHPHPDDIQPGCYVRIGRFADECELLYHDEFHGSLIRMADEVIQLIFTKYLKASIRYDKEVRIERYPYSRSAVREIFFNALVHSNWSDGLPIQIRVDDDRLVISNSCVLPLGWTVDDLTGYHVSRPYNPLIARAFFRAGYIESWGRGISTVCKICAEEQYPAPQYVIKGEDMSVVFPIDPHYMSPEMGIMGSEPEYEMYNEPGRHAQELSGLASKIITVIRHNAYVTQAEIATACGVSRRSVQINIKQLIDSGKIQRIGSKKSGYWMVMD